MTRGTGVAVGCGEAAGDCCGVAAGEGDGWSSPGSCANRGAQVTSNKAVSKTGWTNLAMFDMCMMRPRAIHQAFATESSC
jgi:hypothetical protein